MSASPRSSSDSQRSEHSPNGDYDSSAALIVVHEPEDQDNDPTSFNFSSDDEENAEDEQLERLRSSSVAPLSTTSVFLYLFSPLLKLGALQILDASRAAKFEWAVSALVVFGGLCALTRQVWYMLAKYVRRADMEIVLLETFARGRGKEGLRNVIRQATKFSIGLFRVLLTVVYLRASADVLVPLFPEMPVVNTRIPLTVILAALIAPLCYPKSLAGTSVLYTSWISVVTFVGWLIAMAYAHAKGIRISNPASESLGILWQGISVFAFTFTTSNTLPLYAALKSGLSPGQPKPRRYKTFTLLSVISITIAGLLVLPLVFFSRDLLSFRTQVPSRQPSRSFRAVMAFLNAATLALTIPSIVVTTPPLPLPFFVRHVTNFPVSKTLLYIATIGMSLMPQDALRLVSDAVFVLAFFSTYALPAFIHIIIHTFRRPISIVMPPNTPNTPSPSRLSNTPYPPSPYSAAYAPRMSPITTLNENESRHDELLQRKERTLQRKRLGKRLVWDVGVWVLLLPVSGGGLVWIGGRTSGRW